MAGSHGHAALLGFLVGTIILLSTNNSFTRTAKPATRTRNLGGHIASTPSPTSAPGTSQEGCNRRLASHITSDTTDCPPCNRRLASHINSDTTDCPSSVKPGKVSSAVLWEGSKLTWNKVSDHEVQFKLTASPVPTWFAVGFSHAQKGKNLMIGPPASESVCFELQKDGTGKLAHVSLDSMPPSDTIGKPLASNSSVDIVSGGKASVSFTIDTKLGNYKIPGPDGQTHTFIYAYGESSESSGALGMAYHSPGRRGFVAGIDFNLVKDSKKKPDSLPYYEMHGGSLATIWSVTTLLGGIIARYFRKYAWWIDAHQFLQTVASVLSLPLTVLSYLGKGGSENNAHYTSAHGLFGIIFASSASLQGLLGTFAHASYAHTCGFTCKMHSFMQKVRATHRTLGKLLLTAATVQILLGLQFFDPEFTLLTQVFIIYASVAWMGVLVLEVRHQKNVVAKFKLSDGSGHMKTKDIQFDMTTFETTCNIIDHFLTFETKSTSTMVALWLNGLKETGAINKLKMKMCGSRTVFPFFHYSMTTVDALKFAGFLSQRFEAHGTDNAELLEALRLTIEKHDEHVQSRSPPPSPVVELTKVLPSSGGKEDRRNGY